MAIDSAIKTCGNIETVSSGLSGELSCLNQPIDKLSPVFFQWDRESSKCKDSANLIVAHEPGRPISMEWGQVHYAFPVRGSIRCPVFLTFGSSKVTCACSWFPFIPMGKELMEQFHRRPAEIAMRDFVRVAKDVYEGLLRDDIPRPRNPLSWIVFFPFLPFCQLSFF